MTISHITYFWSLNIVYSDIIALVHFIFHIVMILELYQCNINTDIIS